MADPLEMPNPLPVNSKMFDLGFIQDMTPVGAGFIQTIERSGALWVAQYSTPPLTPARDQLFQAFLDGLYGSNGAFIGFDPRRPRPLTSGLSGSPWAQVVGVQPSCVTASYISGQLHITGLANGFVISPGDYCAFQRGQAWYLHRSKDLVTISGNAVTLNVVPRPVSSAVAVGVRFNRAGAAMKLIGKVTKNDKVDDVGPTYQFNAVQFVDRNTG